MAIDVLANDTDINGDVLSVQSFGQAANGMVVENADEPGWLATTAGLRPIVNVL